MYTQSLFDHGKSLLHTELPRCPPHPPLVIVAIVLGTLVLVFVTIRFKATTTLSSSSLISSFLIFYNPSPPPHRHPITRIPLSSSISALRLALLPLVVRGMSPGHVRISMSLDISSLSFSSSFHSPRPSAPSAWIVACQNALWLHSIRRHSSHPSLPPWLASSFLGNPRFRLLDPGRLLSSLSKGP